MKGVRDNRDSFSLSFLLFTKRGQTQQHDPCFQVAKIWICCGFSDFMSFLPQNRIT